MGLYLLSSGFMRGVIRPAGSSKYGTEGIKFSFESSVGNPGGGLLKSITGTDPAKKYKCL